MTAASDQPLPVVPTPDAADEPNRELKAIAAKDYEWGFVTDIESETIPPGLDEDTVRFISAKKGEPEWLLQWRLEALARWRTMTEPTWAFVKYPPIDYQAIRYYAAPKSAANDETAAEPEAPETER